MPVDKSTWLLLAGVLVTLGSAAAQGGYFRYDLATGCYTPQICQTNGQCLSSSTSTFWDACPAGYYEIASGSAPDTNQTNCYWTGCTFGGCPDGTGQVGASVSCAWYLPNKEYCCKLRTTKTCRQWLACKATWINYTPVFAAGGAWSHAKPAATNAYIGARIADGIYTGDSSTLDGRPYPDADFANWFCAAVARAGARNCKVVVGSGDAEFAVVNLGSSALVLFRGTESLTDLWTDVGLLNFWSSTIPAASASGIPGISTAYDTLVSNVLPAMASTIASVAPNLPMWFVGHSLGGAYATIAAMYWNKLGNTVVGVYTYGTARPGTPDFAAAYQAVLGNKTFRHEHTFQGATIDMIVGTSYGGLSHVGIRVPVERYGNNCPAVLTASHHRHHHLRSLLSKATAPTPSPSTAATAKKAAATTAAAPPPGKDQGRYATFDFTKPWLDPATPYTSVGTSSDCQDTLSLCHTIMYYWRSLYTCLSTAQRTTVGEF